MVLIEDSVPIVIDETSISRAENIMVAIFEGRSSNQYYETKIELQISVRLLFVQTVHQSWIVAKKKFQISWIGQ